MALIGVAVIASDASAAPEADPIALATDDLAFRAAISDALAPSGMLVRLAPDTAPAQIADITAASREIADREHAAATVWFVFVAEGAMLIVYDRGVDRLLVRSLPYGAPLSAAQAAEAARMTRTMLRALRVTEPEPPHPDVVAPAIREPIEPVVVVAAAPRLLAIDVDAGVRMRGPGSTAVIAGALSVVWRPDRLGLALTARFAPAADVDGTLMGRISDQSLAASARLPIRVAPHVDVTAAAGLALHLVDLRGTLGTQTIENRRFDPAIRAGVAATYELGPTIAVGVEVSSDWLVRRQTYEAGAEEVVTIPRIQVAAGLVLTARIL